MAARGVGIKPVLRKAEHQGFVNRYRLRIGLPPLGINTERQIHRKLVRGAFADQRRDGIKRLGQRQGSPRTENGINKAIVRPCGGL